MDATAAAAWLRALVGSLSEVSRASLIPIDEIVRRNSRALVFLPTLHLREGQSPAQRANLMTAIHFRLDTGAHDVGERRPRARWEPTAANRQINRTLALGHRLAEALSSQNTALLQQHFVVQLAGRGAELWYPRSDGRPRRVGSISTELVLTPLDVTVVGLTAPALQTLWSQVVA